jgi:hypothetical protein
LGYNNVRTTTPKTLEYVLKNYLKEYYHPVRTHQGLNCQTPILSDKPPETKVEDTKLVSKSILGGLYHSYKKVAQKLQLFPIAYFVMQKTSILVLITIMLVF